jgi:hypothetical protein
MNRTKGQDKFRTGEFFVACMLASVILVAGGMIYRKCAAAWRGPAAGPVELDVPLSEFPLELNGWTGKDSEIPATIEDYMRNNFADDFVSRRYINQTKQAFANLYVVYCSFRPASILGHRPRVCYKGGGWHHDSTVESTITSISGREIPCLVHRFHTLPPDYQEVFVLNFYVANGTPTLDEDAFLEELGRRVNTERNNQRYVSQIQISSSTESSIRQAATDFVDKILEFLPESPEASESKSAPSDQ